MNTNDWLQSLKVGDEVAVYGADDGPQIGSVVHSTKHYVHVGAIRYRRKDGRRAKRDPWVFFSIKPLTDAIRSEIKTKRRRARAVSKFLDLASRRVCAKLEIEWLEQAVSVMEKANGLRCLRANS